MTESHVQPEFTEAAGARIRVARQAVGLTQQGLAKEVGVSRSAVAQWETGRSGQVGQTLTRVAQVLAVSAEFLLTGQQPGSGPVAENGTELALLRLYRECSGEDQAFLMRTARRLARENGDG